MSEEKKFDFMFISTNVCGGLTSKINTQRCGKYWKLNFYCSLNFEISIAGLKCILRFFLHVWLEEYFKVKGGVYSCINSKITSWEWDTHFIVLLLQLAVISFKTQTQRQRVTFEFKQQSKGCRLPFTFATPFHQGISNSVIWSSWKKKNAIFNVKIFFPWDKNCGHWECWNKDLWF